MCGICVYIRFLGNGYLWFRPYGGSLSKSPEAGPVESNQSAPAPPLGAEPRLGMPERRHCSVGPLRNTCVRPSWLMGRENLRPPRGGLIADLALGGGLAPTLDFQQPQNAYTPQNIGSSLQ
jgi:hypothetical protein